MGEEKKENMVSEEEEKDKSEKLIYVLTGLLVFVIFGAIAVLYFNPSPDEKIYKPKKIQVVADKEANITSKGNTTLKTTSNGNITQSKNIKTVQNNANNGTNTTSIENKAITAVKEENTNTTKTEVAQLTEENNKSIKENNKKTNEPKNTSNNTKEDLIGKLIADKNTENKKENVKEKEKAKNTEKKVAINTHTQQAENKISKKENTISKRERKKVERKYYYIQVSALASMEKARQVKARLERRGFKNVIIIKEKGMYKVLVGRFNSMKEAFKFIREHNIKGGWVRILKNIQ